MTARILSVKPEVVLPGLTGNGGTAGAEGVDGIILGVVGIDDAGTAGTATCWRGGGKKVTDVLEEVDGSAKASLANVGSGEVACPVIEGEGATTGCEIGAEGASRISTCLGVVGAVGIRDILPVVEP